jgi:hypothetical protein
MTKIEEKKNLDWRIKLKKNWKSKKKTKKENYI